MTFPSPFRSSEHVPYIPLASSPSPEPRKRSFRRRYIFLALCFFFISIGWNLFLAIRAYQQYWVNPLDNYQPMNHQPLLHNYTSSHTPADPSQRAVVTTLYDDSFAPAVATLGHSLRQVRTQARLIVLYIPSQVSRRALCIASASGFEPHPVARIAPPRDGKGVFSHFIDQYTKLRLWTLDQMGLESVVYLDADTLVRQNFDELFELRWTFAAVPDVFIDHKGFTTSFNAGVLYLRPNSTTFESMLSHLATASYPPKDAEQSFLNHFFGVQALRLPYAYNFNVAMKKRAEKLWDVTWDEARIVHFTLAKPFLSMPGYGSVLWEEMDAHVEKTAEEWDGGLYRREVAWWGTMFREMKETYRSELEKCWTLSDEKPRT